MLDILDKIDERLMTEGEEDIVHYKGEVFKMGNMDYSGNRALLHPKNKEVVG